MAANDLRYLALWNAGTTDQERDVDIFFVAASLAWEESVVGNVVAVVWRRSAIILVVGSTVLTRSVDDVRVVQQVLLLQLIDNHLDHIVDAGDAPKTSGVVGIASLDLLFGKLSLIGNP